MQQLTERAQQLPPRVQFADPKGESSQPERMIVAWPQKQIVRSPTKSPQKEIVQPAPIIREPKYVTQPEDSIAARMKARKAASTTKVAAANDESIAERVLRRRREIANSIEKAFPVLDPETGQLLEYRQLLRHPKFKDAWNISAANEFGRLAQGIKGRVKATDTIKYNFCKRPTANRPKPRAKIRGNLV